MTPRVPPAYPAKFRPAARRDNTAIMILAASLMQHLDSAPKLRVLRRTTGEGETILPSPAPRCARRQPRNKSLRCRSRYKRENFLVRSWGNLFMFRGYAV